MKITNILSIVILMTSCSVDRNSFDSNYRGEANYRSFYVVDTIKIENPIIINNYGQRVICSKILLKNNRIDKVFFKRPDVFILGENLYYDLHPKDYKRYRYPDDGNCTITKLDTLIGNGITICKYKNDTVRFIMCLINSNYYNVKHNTWDTKYYRIVNNDQKNSYYKIVYPICE